MKMMLTLCLILAACGGPEISPEDTRFDGGQKLCSTDADCPTGDFCSKYGPTTVGFCLPDDVK